MPKNDLSAQQKLHRIVDRVQAFGVKGPRAASAFARITREGPMALWDMTDPAIRMLVNDSSTQNRKTGPWLVSASKNSNLNPSSESLDLILILF